jgi:hypothetical protein
MSAMQLLIARMADSDAATRLVAAASGDPLERRAAAVALVERLGLADRVDWYTSYIKDLEQPETCTRRKEAVTKLRALGDIRAIRPLQAAMNRKGNKGRTRGKLANTCLLEDARAALTFLRDLASQTRDAGPS